MRCGYFEAGLCRSCTWLERPYAEQLSTKQAHVRDLVDPTGVAAWAEPVASAEQGFRNKAKMVVAGTVDAPTLGILDPRGHGTDLRECPLHQPGLHDALPTLAELVTRAGLTPYDVPTRRGELKHLLVTESPDGELMVRAVLRSQEPVARLLKHLPWLREQLPQLRVLTVNLQPAHKAVLEGEAELVLTDDDTLPMRLPLPGGPVLGLGLRPRSFFQTNTAVASELYAQARTWVDEVAPRSLLDLYCGVGGFALATTAPGRTAVGVEVSEEAVRSATTSAAAAGVADRVSFRSGDATAALSGDGSGGPAPDLVVVNPPRRGTGPELAASLEASGVQHVLYSSCRAETMARDLAAMPSLRPVRARLLDMFPHTDHYEVLVLLSRAA